VNGQAVSSHDLIAISRVEARIGAYDWPFALERAADIAAHWAAATAEKPRMFNGRVLLQFSGEVRGEVFDARYFELDYATFLAWHRWGFPETPGADNRGATIRNGFAMGALRTRDNAYIMGVMGEHTANAGKIYFAAGTPDPKDVLADGTVDLAGSVLREMEEELGLAASEVEARDGWRIVLGRERVAFMRDVFIDLPADEAAALIRGRIARQADAELADVAIARSAADIDDKRMPVFMQVFLRHAFAD
jgi:8-oxo-dGTP pyrophosphatase MutT (NUDIX family)